MIQKLPWQHSKHKNTADTTGLSKYRNTPMVLTDKNYQAGKTLLDSEFEDKIAPLLIIKGTQSHIVPIDGDKWNTSIDNMLVATYGAGFDITAEEALAGNVLNVRYDKNTELFIYTETNRGKTQTKTHKRLQNLRNNIGKSPKHTKLVNKKHLLTPKQYLKLYNDYNRGKIDVESKDFDISPYKK